MHSLIHAIVCTIQTAKDPFHPPPTESQWRCQNRTDCVLYVVILTLFDGFVLHLPFPVLIGNFKSIWRSVCAYFFFFGPTLSLFVYSKDFIAEFVVATKRASDETIRDRATGEELSLQTNNASMLFPLFIDGYAKLNDTSNGFYLACSALHSIFVAEKGFRLVSDALNHFFEFLCH